MANKYTKSALQKMEPEALVKIVMEEFGAVPSDDATKTDLVGQIMEAQGTSNNDPSEDAPAPEVSDKADKIEIKIAAGDGPAGEADVYFSHNGIQYLAKRNQWVKIPRKVLSSLTRAVTTNYKRDDETGEVVSRDVPRYNVIQREIIER